MQVVTDPYIQPFQRWGRDVIGILPSRHNGNWYIVTANYATGWSIARAILDAVQEAIAEFISQEIYMHYGAPQEIFTNNGRKPLWGRCDRISKENCSYILRHHTVSPSYKRECGVFERHPWGNANEICKDAHHLIFTQIAWITKLIKPNWEQLILG